MNPNSLAEQVRHRGEEIGALVERMRCGDRTAAALFITRYGSRIRRRIRGKLSPAMRRIFDSQDILSTLGRRLDQYVRLGHMEVADEGELWALIFRMADNAIIDKARVFGRLQRAEAEDGTVAQELMHRLRAAERESESGVEVEIGRVLDMIKDATDRQILYLWLMDTTHVAISEHIGLTSAAVRKRWQKIRALLHERLAGEEMRR